MTAKEFTQHALSALMRDLGPDGLARFLRLNCYGTGDYTRDREQWQKELTLDQILESIRKHSPDLTALVS